MKGFVYLVGAGPGDASFITAKGQALLSQCDVVIYDRLASPLLLLQVKDTCKKIYVGKKPGAHTLKQDEINRILVDEAKKGQVVVRLKGGDSFVFGRGGEEILALEEAGIGYEVIPGITSAIAVPELAGIPVTHRGVSQSFHVVTGHTVEGVEKLTSNYQALANSDGTLLFLMGLSHLTQIIERLLAEGMSAATPIAVIEKGTTVYQRIFRGTFADIVQQIEAAGVSSPVMIVIGDVTKLHFTMQRPKIGLMGTSQLVNKMMKQIHPADWQAYPFPYVDIQERGEDNIKRTLQNIEAYHWIVFTSANGIRIFFALLVQYGIDMRRLSHVQFAVIGQGTAQSLASFGFHADFMPKQFYAEQLGMELADFLHQQEEQHKTNVLIPRARLGNPKLVEILTSEDIAVTDLPIYDTIVKEEICKEAQNSLPYLDCVTFASASGVRFLCEGMEPEAIKQGFANTRVICIGQETAKMLTTYGITNYEVAKEATIQGLLAQMERT